MATNKTINEVLERLSEYYRIEPSDAQLEIYFNTLSDLGDDALRKAAYEHIKNSKWFPKVAELRDAAVKVAGNFNSQEQDYPKWLIASDLLNASFRGEIIEAELYANPHYQIFIRRHAAHKQRHPEIYETKEIPPLSEEDMNQALMELQEEWR